MTEPAALKNMTFILGKTLGKVKESVHKAALWGMLQVAPKSFRENAAQAGHKPEPSWAKIFFSRSWIVPKASGWARSIHRTTLQISRPKTAESASLSRNYWISLDR